MVGFILYSLGVLLVGFICGTMFKHIIDRDAIRQLQQKYNSLHRENVYLKKIQQGKVVEIHDDRVPEVNYGGF